MATESTYTSNLQDYDAYYNQGLNQAMTAYNAQRTELEKARAAEEAGLKTQLDAGKATLGESLASAQKQAYASQMNQQKNLPQQLAALGITGGGSESMLSNLLANYQNTRGTAQRSYDGSIKDLLTQFNTNNYDLAARYSTNYANLLGDAYGNAMNQGNYLHSSAMDRDNNLWSRAFSERQYETSKEQWQREFDFAQQQWEFNKSQAIAASAPAVSSGGSSKSSSSSGKSSGSSGKVTNNGLYFGAGSASVGTYNPTTGKYTVSINK